MSQVDNGVSQVDTGVPSAAQDAAILVQRNEHKRRVRSGVLAAVVVLALAIVPLVAPSHVANSLSRVLALALLAVSLYMLVGVSGMPSRGHAAPFGVGAYVAGLTAKDVSAFAPLPLLAAVVGGAVFAAFTGWFIVLSKGSYVLIVTIPLG